MIWDLYRHRPGIDRLLRVLQEGHGQHAFLFIGPKGLGKSEIMHRIAAELLGTTGDNTYSHIVQGVHPNIVESPRDMGAKIDDIKEVNRKASLTFEGKNKVVLVHHVDEMTTEAANAFLKTLEEPAPGVVMLLSASSLEGVLPTIHSRAQCVELPLLTYDEIVGLGERIGGTLSAEDQEKALHIASGRGALFCSLIEHEEAFDQYQLWYGYAKTLLESRSFNKKYEIVEALDGERKDLILFFEVFTSLLRTVYLNKVQAGLSAEERGYYLQLLSYGVKARTMLQGNVHKRLVLDTLLTHL